MKTDVERAYDALMQLRTDGKWKGFYTTDQTREIREDLCVGMDTMKRALWWHELEDEIEAAEDLYSVKQALQKILKKVA